jgi:MFS family permease
MNDLPIALPIARNTALLSAALAANSGMLQLQAAVASITLVQVLGIDGLLGLGPAVVLACGALAAPFAGRAMDRFGRIPVLATGFSIGAVGGVVAAIGSASENAVLVFGAFVLIGVASGIALLARTAAGDMYPPERRAHGIALVLFGAVFGAILGPAVFSPMLSGKHLDGDSLAPLWLAGSGFMVVALVLVLMVRPDPRRIADMMGTGSILSPSEPPPDTSVPLSQIVRRPGVIPALLAAQASFGVMVGVMTLTGSVVVDHMHHAPHNVFPIIGAHVIGMFVLLMVVCSFLVLLGFLV